jgi:hypothetical protein
MLQNRPTVPVLAWICRASEALFRDDDALARLQGWQITVNRGGFGRYYRDPRFDTLHACPLCDGSGESSREPSFRCSGTGRVTRIPSQWEGELP